jgi:peptidylprolyl isomerase
MAKVEDGDTVRVHFTGKVGQQVFDTTKDDDPFQFTIGAGEVISGFEQAVVGMQPGEARTVEVPAEDAYGAHREDMVLVVDRDRFPDDLELEQGQQLRIEQQDGTETIVMVSDLSESKVVLDANHPLAGEDLTFEVELVEIL